MKNSEGNFNGKASAAGHMWYQVNDGTTKNSDGFSPRKESNGLGEVVRSDTDTYHQPGSAARWKSALNSTSA